MSLGIGENSSPEFEIETQEEEEIEVFYKYGRCLDCNQLLIVMNTSTGSVLPVEMKDKSQQIHISEIFDSKQYTSHLKNCNALALRWKKLKWKYIEKRNGFSKMKGKELLK